MAKSVRRVVLGISGSIAAYKAPLIVRGFVKKGVEVNCVMTPNAAHFVTPLTLATLSRRPVSTSLHDPALWEMAHLSLASWADIVVIAPATADLIARLAQGRAEGLLDSLVLSTQVPVAICPSMDTEMWEHKATRENIKTLMSYGYRIWGPEKGELASGKVGFGRMIEPEEIVSLALK